MWWWFLYCQAHTNAEKESQVTIKELARERESFLGKADLNSHLNILFVSVCSLMFL